MTSSELQPNELADLYEALYTTLEALPADTHPAWELAIESVLFGGEALAPNATSYGEQQAERNDFKISDYRTHYGDGNTVQTFPTLTTSPPRSQDQQYVDAPLQIPVAPDSETVLPLAVDTDTLPAAVQLLNEFPTAPAAQSGGTPAPMLLNPAQLPGLNSPSSSTAATHEADDPAPGESTAAQSCLPPNELADLYDALCIVLDAIPDTAHPGWNAAIESLVFGGEYLRPDATAYGAQQADRNGFGMPEYRSEYGDGDRVTDFPTIPTARPKNEDARYVDEDIELPVAPGSATVLPLAPTEDTLPAALELLAEFPATPNADTEPQQTTALLDTDSLLADYNVEPPTDSADRPPQAHSSTTENSSPGETTIEPTQPPVSEHTASASTEQPTSTAPEASADEATSPTVLRDESAGENTAPVDNYETSSSTADRKYEDADAERAHRRAQQRDPSDVVELGEEITLTLKQVDYQSRPPTIMGTKQRLVIFVVDAPQDLSQYDTIRATVVDYGGKNNSAEAAFSGYVK